MGSLSAFFTTPTPAVRPETYRSFVVLGVAAASAAALHLAVTALFGILGVWPLVWLNVGSVLGYLLAVQQNRRGRPLFVAVYGLVELTVHQALCVYLIGWDSGFQYYLLTIIGVVFFLPPGRTALKFGMVAGAGLAFCLLLHYSRSTAPVYAVAPDVLAVLHYSNLVAVFGLLGLFGYHYSRAAAVSEAQLLAEHRRSHGLLLNILPASIVERLGGAPQVVADGIDAATILFADIVGFTPLASEMSASALVAMLNDLFSELDDLAGTHGLEKIKTIGDAYMVAAGVPEPRADHARAIAGFALDMRAHIESWAARHGRRLSMRVGIHSGPVVAGVIGKRKFSYDLWGDSVNTAARMESHGVPGEIQVSAETHALLQGEFDFDARGPIDIKGKGPMRTWLLRGVRRAGLGPETS